MISGLGEQMAADTCGLMDYLGIYKAVACGFSMGGMIDQNMAIEFPDYLAGMICMGSSTGDLHLPPPDSSAGEAMTAPPPSDRDGFIDHTVSVYRVFANGSQLYNPECAKAIAGICYDRGLNIPGVVRQSAAMLADGSPPRGWRV